MTSRLTTQPTTPSDGLPDADAIFVARLMSDEQHLAQLGLPLTPELLARYWPTDQKLPRRCPVCLRVFDVAPVYKGKPRRYCSGYCAAWAAQPRRRTRARRWLTCQVCGCDLWALDDRDSCPPPAPTAMNKPSPCRVERARRMAVAEKRRSREKLKRREAERTGV